jgi:CheY-like chemotaxis protein
MVILLVEDDEIKCGQILNVLKQDASIKGVTVAKSYRSGLERVLHERFDLVLLDMTMPTYEITLEEEGGRPRAFAGRDILRQMKRRAISMPVVVVTQFEKFGDGAEVKTRAELDRELWTAHSGTYRGMVYYNVTQEGWKDELASKIAGVRETE